MSDGKAEKDGKRSELVSIYDRKDAPDIKIIREIKLEDLGSELKANDKAALEGLYQAILDLNGAQTDMVAGQPKTYIDRRNYVQWVNALPDGTGRTLNATQIDVIQQALNFQALGGGKMGCLGAQLRRELWAYFSKDREATQVNITGVALPPDVKQTVLDYKDQLERYNILSAAIRKNAKSFAAQAGINLYTKMHHWDSKNQREWQALIAALGIGDELSGDDLRPLVYLALHPIPLLATANFRRAASGTSVAFDITNPVEGDGKLGISATGFVNSVVIRARSIPAGYATFSVCAAAWRLIQNETYGARLAKYVEDSGNIPYTTYLEIIDDIQRNGEAYHPMARDFGYDLKTIDSARLQGYMHVAAAYIYEIAKGTLSRSAALQKFRDQNSRIVSLWQTRFRLEKGADRDSVTAFLTAHEKKVPSPAVRLAAIEADKAIGEAVEDYAKGKLKMLERLREIAKEGEISIADITPPSERLFIVQRPDGV